MLEELSSYTLAQSLWGGVGGVEGDSDPSVNIFNTEGAGPESRLGAETNGKESGTVSKRNRKKQLLYTSVSLFLSCI